MMMNKMRVSRQSLLFMNRRLFSASAQESYHSLDDQHYYTPVNKVQFNGSKFTVFNGDGLKERKFVPFEFKEITAKYSLIAGLLWTNNYIWA